MSSSSTLNPLNLPEITFHLGPFLTRRCLLACIQVSRTWYHAFHPLLWFHIRLVWWDTVVTTPPDPEVQETFLHLQKNAPLIQSLSLNKLRNGGDHRCLSLTFPRLHNLRVLFEDPIYNSQVRERVAVMVKRHAAGLHSLTLVNMRIYSLVWDVLQACLCHPIQLRVLTLRGVHLPFDHWSEGQRELLSTLDTLALHNCSIEFRKNKPQDDAAEDIANWNPGYDLAESPLEQRGVYWKDIEGVKIQCLSMTGTNIFGMKEEYHLLLNCRELRSLQWTIKRGVPLGDRKPALARELRAARWPFLEKLELTIAQYSDEELAEILVAMPRPLKTLRMDGTAFGDACARALLDSGAGHHRKSLECLSLVGCAQLRGSMVQRFLCEFLHLRQLHARILTDQDIVKDPRPWVCQYLRDLQVGFARQRSFNASEGLAVENTSEDQSSTSVLFDRLAGLCNLHTLGFMDSEPVQEHILIQEKDLIPVLYNLLEYHRLSIENGLDLLKTLTGLRVLKFGKTDQELTLEEARWMVKLWPRLRSVAVSRASTDKETLTRLREFFGSHGVSSH